MKFLKTLQKWDFETFLDWFSVTMNFADMKYEFGSVFTVHWKRAWKYEMKILPQFFFRCARSCHVGRQHKFLEKNCFLKASAINEGKWHIQASCFGVLKISVKNTSVLKFLFCRINSCQFEFLCKLDIWIELNN